MTTVFSIFISHGIKCFIGQFNNFTQLDGDAFPSNPVLSVATGYTQDVVVVFSQKIVSFVNAMSGFINFNQINPIFTFILHVKLPSL
jgi:hypothetical protein